MVVNYSKWDALELSDDSDIEVHPNVDKRSFIRAKQNQIHQQRFERRHQIETLKYERTINDGLLQRIDSLLNSLQKHAQQAAPPSQNPDDFMMNALMDCAGDGADDDEPPKPPAGVHRQTEQPRYSVMMASLVDQVKKDAGDKLQDWFKTYLKGIQGHRTKVEKLQTELMQKLGELEKEEGKKITSDSIRTGFSVSLVSKEKEKEKPAAKSTAETVEVLNPGALRRDSLKRLDSAGQSSGAEADVEDEVKNPAKIVGDDEDEEHIEPTALGKAFAKIKMGDYKECLQFISENRDVVKERETDGLLVEAFNAQMEGRPEYARNCVHQALLLQYCRSLGRDGVGLFFKRITTPSHQAQKVFQDDVNGTYARIRTRTAEITKERAANPKATETERIQLHAVDPNTSIHINIPPASPTEEVEVKAREIFDTFPPGLQRALERGELEKVNEVLGKMSVEEAEEVVEKLGEGGMLSVEEGVIDKTTEEGREKLKALEEKARAEKSAEEDAARGGEMDGREIADVDG
ncbi:MAG: hypothetical protein LQ343_004502 [Gyalolechia ehrenbergii]|nr:MAG: hypothetical protein LQ343_004502 [Gyalolechia ehrenbergii]